MSLDLELHGHSDIFFFGVNHSGLGTSLTTNHILFYRALGQLHDPWCNKLTPKKVGFMENCEKYNIQS